MIFWMKLAGRLIEVQPIHSEIRKMCHDYLDISRSTPEIMIKITPEDIAQEASEAAKREKGVLSAAYLETAAVHRKLIKAMLSYDTFLMHGSVVSTEGRGYMITAPSGTGKTTRTRLWLDHIPGSFVVNGDKPLLRLEGDTVYAYGTPWCGKEGWGANTSVPLRAILILERSEDGNSVERLRFSDAFPMLLRQTFRPDGSEAKKQTLHLLSALADRVRVYRFRSEPTAEAVRLAFEAVREE